MNRLHVDLKRLLCYASTLSVLSFASCVKSPVMMDAEYQAFYRVVGLNIDGNCIEPVCAYDAALDLETRNYYTSLDTSLCFRIFRSQWSTLEKNAFNAIDWRISRIEVTTLEDYDYGHPEGSSINDMLQLNYWYKDKLVTIPLAHVYSESVMLTDYGINRDFLYLRTIDEMKALPSVEVHIDDAFGHHFSARTK